MDKREVKERETESSQWCPVREQETTAQTYIQETLLKHKQKEKNTVRVVKHWHMLS